MLRASTALSAFALFTLAGSALAQGTCPEQAAQCPAAQGSPQVSVVRASLRHGEKDIVDTAVAAGKFNTLAAALKAAGLVDTLKGDGPFTVFAPTDEAFAKLPKGTVETLLKPENKAKLTKILTCHVVAANAMSPAIAKMIADDKGTHPVKTVGGCVLQAKMMGDKITLTDETGNVATVTIADVRQSNGVIHVIDTVLLPKG